jgi:hypothetical protein
VTLRCLVLLAASIAPATACAQVSVQSLAPQAAAPGKTTEVVVRGSKLDEPLRVWTSFPAQVQVVQENVEAKGRAEVKLQVTIDAATPPQVGGLFVATADGVSSPAFYMIDDLPSVADNGKNRSLAEAQEIPLLAAVDGIVDGAQPDCFKLNVAAGQRIAVEVVAARVGSDLDPILRLVDANGKVLVTADDDLSAGSDGRFAHTFTAAGTYYLQLRDVRYRGGPGFRYRLRVGDFPIGAAVFPLGVTAQGSRERQAVGLKENSQSSALATQVATELPQGVEVEPNDAPETATKVAIPGGINGRFHAEKDRDQFTFEAKANTNFIFKPITRSVGSPCYLQLSIFKPDGGLLAEAPVTDSDEQPLTVTFPVDGVYRLTVEDLLRRGGPEFVYHVETRPFAGVSLSLKADKNVPHTFALAKNGGISLEVQAARAGYDGPITLGVEPADRGFVLLNNVIGEKQPAARMMIIAPPNLNLGEPIALRIVGTLERNGQKFRVPVSTAALIRAKSPQIAYPPAWLDGLLATAITNDAPELFTITPSATQVFYPRSAAQVGFTLIMDRKQGEFKDPLTVLPQNLPAGVAVEIKREGNGPQEKYNVLLKAPKEVAEAKQEITFQCYGEMKGQGRLLSVKLPLAIITPLVATVAPEGPISPGQKQKVKVSVVRFNPGAGEDKQPVTIKWKKLPPGVTAAGDATIAADQTETIVELSAAADAKVGEFDGLVVDALTKFQGADVTVESAAVKWEVK